MSTDFETQTNQRLAQLEAKVFPNGVPLPAPAPGPGPGISPVFVQAPVPDPVLSPADQALVDMFRREWRLGLTKEQKAAEFKAIYGKNLGESILPLPKPFVPAQVKEYAIWGYRTDGTYAGGLTIHEGEDRDAVTAQAMNDIAFGKQTFANGFPEFGTGNPVEATVAAVITMTGIACSYAHWRADLGASGNPWNFGATFFPSFESFVASLNAGGQPSGG